MEFTSTSVILQFLNSLDSPRTSLTITLLLSVLAYITSLNTVFPSRITLNSHISFQPTTNKIKVGYKLQVLTHS